MKRLLLLLGSLFGYGILAVAPCQASYYEVWMVEAEVVEIYGKERTAKILAEQRGIHAEKAFVGMKIRVTKCDYVEGHGRVKCKKDQVLTMVLNYDPKLAKGGFEKGMRLKIRYFYGNSAVPEGQPSDSHLWQLAEVLKAAGAAAKAD